MSRLDKYVMPAMISLAAVAGCEGKVTTNENVISAVEDAGADAADEGINGDAAIDLDAGNDADAANDASDAQVQPELLTRGEMVRGLVYDVMGYTGPCQEQVFPDTPSSGELCHSLEVLRDMDFVTGYPNGLFRPDDGVNVAELAKFVTGAMGYIPYESDCLAGIHDIDQSSWYAPYVGAMCENGYPIADENGYVKPGEPVTMETWTRFMMEMNEAQQGLATRGQVARLLTKIVMDASPAGSCNSSFSDVPDDSSLCEVVQYVDDQNIMNGYVDANNNPIGIFGPEDIMTYSQLVKFDALATGVPVPAVQAGCSGVDQTQWYAAYMDSLCNEGLIDNTWSTKAYQDVTSRDAYKLAWDSDIWRTANIP